MKTEFSEPCLSLNFRIFFESENFQNLNLKMIEIKKISTKLMKVKNIPKPKPKSENFQGEGIILK